MASPYSVVITTASSDDEAKIIATALLSKQLAACVQLMPIQSYYTWKGQLQTGDEQLLLIKTKRSHFAAVQQCILDNHSYETPEVIEVPITDGLPSYLNWIDEVTSEGFSNSIKGNDD